MEMIMKKYVKEVWVKFDNRDDYSENEEKLFSILDRAPGESIVIAYLENTRERKVMSGHSFDETHLSLLTDVFDDDNVKFWEKERPEAGEILPGDSNLFAGIMAPPAPLVKGVIDLADVEDGPHSVTAFHGEFGLRISRIRSIRDRNKVLEDMSRCFEMIVRDEPENRDELSRVYGMLKQRCWQMELRGNQGANERRIYIFR